MRADLLPKEQAACSKAQHQGCNESDQPQSPRRGRKRPFYLTDADEPLQKRPRTQETEETPELPTSSNQPAQCVCKGKDEVY